MLHPRAPLRHFGDDQRFDLTQLRVASYSPQARRLDLAVGRMAFVDPAADIVIAE